MMRLVIVAALCALAVGEELPPSCHKKVFCDSELLHHVQMAHLYPDSKTFVDLHMRYDEETTLDNFEQLMAASNRKPSPEQIQKFVNENFDEDRELEFWTPSDYSSNPRFISGIRDENLKKFGKAVHNIWPELGRKVRREVIENPERYSLIPVTHGFIIPGGRFREIYYWDTYWILEGLLISGMHNTARGMLENLLELLQTLGHIPNGSRWYYENRSQPPLLIPMVEMYYRETGDYEFLRDNIDLLEAELEYWLDTQVVTFKRNGKSYSMLHYNVPSAGPRPESYSQDYTHAQAFDNEDRQQHFYNEIKNAAESGWDFSSRWFIDEKGGHSGNLTNIHTSDIIPVDLNAMFANALQIVSNFRGILKQKGASQWAYLAKEWRNAIDEVLWDNEDGIWYDYDIRNNKHRQLFFPTNLTPLWMKAVDKRSIAEYGPRVIEYLKRTTGLDFPGGVPSSLDRTGEQWDFPNAWPPLISIVVNSLEAIRTPEAKEHAFNVAQIWIRSNWKGFSANNMMFEKYDSEVPGQRGGGGEYNVQEGFGWSNGVVLEFLYKYGWSLTAEDSAVKSK